MAHGGRRNGSGRKKGAATKKTRAVADADSAKGLIEPLQVLLEVMRRHYDAGRFDEAAEIARHAAPYKHPRLSAVQHTGKGGDPIQLDVTEVIVTSREQANVVLTRNGTAGAVPGQ